MSDKKTDPWVYTDMPDFCYNRNSKFNKIIRALERVVVEKELITHRNTESLRILVDMIPLYPQIEDALKEETDSLIEWIDCACAKLSLEYREPATLVLEGWWYNLLKEPKELATVTGFLKVIRRPSDPSGYDYGEGYSFYLNETTVGVNDKKYAEAIEEYEKRVK